ncbi:MAG: cob(I)yrinic acid a,c-diamide adenosyltransferase [Phycisphaerae bacterium]|nr:cob(I)yrinic acid a,c-diamide adenosyltransferase [Phycisphaerae bacterium]MBN8596561.1 cob(I)yrinic acid a,c-diamide adenosyltransferase [Planctomycetota bacterium]
MVKLNKIYTRTGDDGTTGLVGGQRVRKTAPRVEAYGTVDEANSFIGLAVLHAGEGSKVFAVLRAIQNDLFDVGADLATPIAPDERPGAALRITAGQVERLERLIDEFNEPIPALTSFVLPGGTPLAAELHAARTVSRRAERAAVALLDAEPAATSPEAIRYLNRLSDLLFVLARAANANGASDVLWRPGAGRSRD